MLHAGRSILDRAGSARLARRVMALVCIISLLSAVTPSLAANEEKAVTLSADMTRWSSDDKVTATGNVKAVYQDYTITSDSAEADLQTNIAVFKGHVKLITKQHTVDGEDLTMNLKTKEWSFDNANSRLDPVALKAGEVGTTSPTFIHSAVLKGKGEDLSVMSGTLTTCDQDHPHYYFSAKELDIFPGSKIIAHNVSMVGLDKKLFTMNAMVIPIRGFKENLIPQVGSSAEEGMYLKTAYAYSATANSQGFLKLDLMQKRGIGIGADQSYKLAAGSGEATLYYLADKEIGGSNITGTLRHEQKLGAIDLNLTGNYRTNNYMYYPGSTSQDWQAVLSHLTPRANTALTFRTNSTNGYGTSDTFSTSLRHTQQFSEKLNGTFSMDMRSYNSTGMTASDRELESSFELRDRQEKYDLSLVASKRVDLDKAKYTGDDYYSNLDRLPELTFATDSYRLGKSSFFGLPSRLSVTAGRYHEMPSGISANRLLLQWDMLGQTYDISDKNELNLTAGFRQAFYAADMMQYVLKGGGILTTRYNDFLKTRLSYNYQSPSGYSPFRFDYTGKYNYMRAVMDYQDEKKLRWSLSSGYDFNQHSYPWQDVTVKLTAHPDDKFSYSFSTGYDLNRSKWRSLITQFRVVDSQRMAIDMGVRYDIQTGKLGLARGQFMVPVGDKWKLEAITSWNGATQQFDYKAFRITRDLHCWEASLVYNDETGFREDRGLRLEFRIKAFPSSDRFGIGQYGQAVDTSMGEYYY